MNCLNCDCLTSNPKFCSKSCSAKYNNKVFPKRLKEGLCKTCEIPICSGYVYCNTCFTKARDKKQKILSYKPKVIRIVLSHCEVCNSELTKINRKANLCKSCNLLRLKKKRNDLKKQLINIKGGCCEQCGYNKNQAALQFHHRDPNQKDFQISQKLQRVVSQDMIDELEKCSLLCANCHFELHNPN